MTIFTSRNPAGQAAMELGLMSVGIANLIQDCNEAGMRAVEEGRERRAAYRYACDLNAAKGRADELGRIAIRAVRHVAALEDEVRRLRNAVKQRQRMIDGLKSGRISLAESA